VRQKISKKDINESLIMKREEKKEKERESGEGSGNFMYTQLRVCLETIGNKYSLEYSKAKKFEAV